MNNQNTMSGLAGVIRGLGDPERVQKLRASQPALLNALNDMFGNTGKNVDRFEACGFMARIVDQAGKNVMLFDAALRQVEADPSWIELTSPFQLVGRIAHILEDPLLDTKVLTKKFPALKNITPEKTMVIGVLVDTTPGVAREVIRAYAAGELTKKPKDGHLSQLA